MNTKSIGERTEACVLAALLKAGYAVLLPFGDNQRYDMVIDDSESFKRVQCKTARTCKRDSGAFEFHTCSSYAHRGGGRKDYRGEIEFFGVYYPETDSVYLVPVEEVGTRQGTLRLQPARNGQQAGIRLADDYKI